MLKLIIIFIGVELLQVGGFHGKNQGQIITRNFIRFF